MKNTLKGVILTLFVLLPQLLSAQPEDGKVYRLISRYYPTLAATEDISTKGIVTRTKGNMTAFEQMWRFDAAISGFTLTNLLTGNAITHYGGSNNQYWADPSEAPHSFQLVSPAEGYWNVRHNTGMGGLHAAWTGKVVYWWDNAAEATQWKLEEITNISQEQLSLQQLVYREYVDLATHEAEYNDALKKFFTDESCSDLLPAYASASDDDLRAALSDLPACFTDIALKIRNNSWGHREREFRIRDYSAYSDPDYWYSVLLTNRWGRINNPTGIYGNKNDIILVFVGDDIPAGATLQLEYIKETSVEGSAVDLHKGLNVLTVAEDESMMYIQYIGTTTPDDDRLITDYPPLRIHIENGIVNGFWHMSEHTDEDWVDILNHATAKAIDVKGDKVMYHMHTSVMRQNCPNGIHDAIDWWEDMLRWQHDIMGLEDYVPQKCNNMACAITLDDDHTYMAATWYRTQYHVNVAYKILNFSTVVTDPDYCFGPAHENGHMNQDAINIVGCTESSNGVLENLIVWKIGKYLTRGPVNASMWNEYAQGLPWISRSNDSMLRLQWQLYLYFHECGVDTTFWPRVFQTMRQHPLAIRHSGKKEVKASEDMLFFAKVCCDVAQMDLSDFFRVYGYLVPHEKMESRESGNYLTTSQKDIDDFLAYASRYPKAPPIEFMDDRIKPVPRTDGGSGARLTYDYGVGQCGDVGQYTDFLDTSVPADGYIYSRSGSTLTIKNGTGAVGFRLYNKEDGRLLYLSNSLRFTLPANCQDVPLHIVAVQADGTEVRIPSTAEAGTEAEQLAALKASLSSAKTILDLRDDMGFTVGRYFGFALDDLQTAYDAASAARDTEDQSLHTYGQWSLLIDDAVQAVLKNDEARVPLYPENIYALYLTRYKNYTLNYLTNGPKGNTLDPATNDSKQWQFIPVEAEEKQTRSIQSEEYVLMNVSNGLFVTTVEAEKRAKMQSDDITKAVHFTFQYTNSGLVNIAICNSDLFLTYNADKEAIGSREANPWRIATVIDNHTAALEARADSWCRVASYIFDELQSSHLVVRSDDFEALRQQFLNALSTVKDIREQRVAGRLDLRLGDLSLAINALTPAYCDPDNLSKGINPYPGATEEDGYQSPATGWYFYLQNLKTGAFAYYNDQGGRYDGCLRMGVLENPDDKRFQFHIEQDERGQFYLRNAYSERVAALWSSYIDVSGKRTPAPFTITFDDESKGFLIADEEGCWTAQTTGTAYAQYRANGSPWKFITAGYMDNTSIKPQVKVDSESTLYDLTGCPVVTPVNGIYIRQGRKVLIW